MGGLPTRNLQQSRFEETHAISGETFAGGSGWTAEVTAGGSEEPAQGSGSGSFTITYSPIGGLESIILRGTCESGECVQEIRFFIWDEYSPPLIEDVQVNPNPVAL